MTSKQKNTEILAKKLMEKNFKVVLNPNKLVFPINTWDLDSHHIAWCSIDNALNKGDITKQQAKSYKNNLKNHIKEGKGYFKLNENIQPIYDCGYNYHINLGELQKFFKVEKDNSFTHEYGISSGIFNTKDILLNSFKYFANSCLDLENLINVFFKYIPYLKSVALTDGCKVDSSAYCCDDCDGDYSEYIRYRTQHLADMAYIYLERKIQDTY